jgi:hypothetical protein
MVSCTHVADSATPRLFAEMEAADWIRLADLERLLCILRIDLHCLTPQRSQ